MTGVVVHVDPERCCASGGCIAIAPGHFELGELGTARASREAFEPADLVVLRAAEESCPFQAIVVVTDQP